MAPYFALLLAYTFALYSLSPAALLAVRLERMSHGYRKKSKRKSSGIMFLSICKYI
ncbi:hypothetical protein DB42_BK00090 [Neochlamydia sp. EPS4]|nr:hypothetical protein DB42_BK00090 [Neochlamydia sp. EPS4]